MEDALELAHANDTKERNPRVERLHHQLLEASRKTLSTSEVTSLIDVFPDLLIGNDFRVSQGALQTVASAVVLSGEHLKLNFNALVPAVVERLGDAEQQVRDAAGRLLLTLMEVSSPTIIVKRAGSYAWAHRRWRVSGKIARTIVQMLSDPNLGVREAATSCIEETYSQAGTQFLEQMNGPHHTTSTLLDVALKCFKRARLFWLRLGRSRRHL